MLKRFLALLICLLLTVSAIPVYAEQQEDNSLKGALGEALLEQTAHPEDQPYLALYVEYEKTDEYCTTHAKATLLYVNSNGKSDNPAAQDIVIELKTEDTLELAEGSDYHVFFDDLACGGSYTFEFDLFCEFPMEKVEKAPEPRLTITVESSNVGSCEYTCTFDSTTEPRALIWGWETGDTAPNAIQNDIAMMEELFGKSYYNMQPVEVEGNSHYNHENIWMLVEQMSQMETDDNDVTYIYVNAHGATVGDEQRIVPGFFAFAPGSSVTIDGQEYKDKDLVLYNQFFQEIQQRVKGKVVFVLDVCFSGMAISRAENAGFEDDQMSLLTAVDDASGAGVYDNWLTEDYGWFTKEIYDEFSGRTGEQTIGDVYSYTRKLADTSVQFGPFATINPQFTGNSDTAIFCFDPNGWMEDPEFVVVEEKLEIQVPVDSVVVTTETYVDEGEHFRARIVRPHVYAEANPELTAIIDAALDEMYQEKMDKLEERKSSAAQCKSDMQTHTETLTLTAAYSTGGLITLSFQNGYFICSVGHNCNEIIVYRFDIETGEQLEMEDLLDLENNPNAKEDFIEQIGVCLEAEGASSSDASKVYSEALKNRYAQWDISPRGIEFSIDRMNSGIGCWGAMVPYEKLKGILKAEYLPQGAAGEAEISLGAYDAAAVEEGTLIYDNTTAVNALTLNGMASHLWVENSYGRNELDGSCSYFYAYGLNDALITLPDAQNAEYGYSVMWIDGSGEHIEDMKAQ